LSGGGNRGCLWVVRGQVAGAQEQGNHEENMKQAGEFSHRFSFFTKLFYRMLQTQIIY
jgi:hypothetical protein